MEFQEAVLKQMRALQVDHDGDVESPLACLPQWAQLPDGQPASLAADSEDYKHLSCPSCGINLPFAHRLTCCVIDNDPDALNELKKGDGNRNAGDIWRTHVHKARDWLGQSVLHIAEAAESAQISGVLWADNDLKPHWMRLEPDRCGRSIDVEAHNEKFKEAEKFKLAEDGKVVDFWFIDAEKLRTLPETHPKLPRFQELWKIHKDWFKCFTIKKEHAFLHKLKDKFLIISHRWEEAKVRARPPPQD